MSKIGINGFGRTGRMALRAALEKHAQIVAINDAYMNLEHMAYLLKYDSTLGRFKGLVETSDGCLVINGEKVITFQEQDPKLIPWSKAKAEYIIESTGEFRTVELASGHMKGGAQKVIITAISEDAPMYVMGVNLEDYDPSYKVISSAACSTVAVAPLVKLIHDNFEFVEGLMTTVHSFTGTQKVIDGAHQNLWRNGRAIGHNIIPQITNSGEVIGDMIPALNGKLKSLALRIPVPNISCIVLTARLGKAATFDEIKSKIKLASEGPLKGILGYTEEEVVSTDFIGDSHCSVFDSTASNQLNPHFTNLTCWYDNEHGYSSQLIDLIKHIQTRDA